MKALVATEVQFKRKYLLKFQLYSFFLQPNAQTFVWFCTISSNPWNNKKSPSIPSSQIRWRLPVSSGNCGLFADKTAFSLDFICVPFLLRTTKAHSSLKLMTCKKLLIFKLILFSSCCRVFNAVSAKDITKQFEPHTFEQGRAGWGGPICELKVEIFFHFLYFLLKH